MLLIWGNSHAEKFWLKSINLVETFELPLETPTRDKIFWFKQVTFNKWGQLLIHNQTLFNASENFTKSWQIHFWQKNIIRKLDLRLLTAGHKEVLMIVVFWESENKGKQAPHHMSVCQWLTLDGKQMLPSKFKQNNVYTLLENQISLISFTNLMVAEAETISFI